MCDKELYSNPIPQLVVHIQIKNHLHRFLSSQSMNFEQTLPDQETGSYEYFWLDAPGCCEKNKKQK